MGKQHCLPLLKFYSETLKQPFVMQVSGCEHGKVDVQKVFGPEAKGLVAHMNTEGQHRGAVAAARAAAAAKTAKKEGHEHKHADHEPHEHDHAHEHGADCKQCNEEHDHGTNGHEHKHDHGHDNGHKVNCLSTLGLERQAMLFSFSDKRQSLSPLVTSNICTAWHSKV